MLDVKTFKMSKKKKKKKLEDSKPRIIETIEKIYDQSHYTKKIYKRKMLLKQAKQFQIMQK